MKMLIGGARFRITFDAVLVSYAIRGGGVERAAQVNGFSLVVHG
jgi:hypothetical protein